MAEKTFSSQRHFSVELPPWEEIIEIMYDKNLSFENSIVKVIYSNDKTKRYVILRSDKELYSFKYEVIMPIDADEFAWLRTDSFTPEDVLPAQWETPPGEYNSSFFETVAETMKELVSEYNYRMYFTDKS